MANRIPVCLWFVLLVTPLLSQSSTPWKDPSPHRTQFVAVEKDVRLEVLDWGGSGRPIVLLAGGGNTAHIFDDFAPKLISCCHVYAITRRGFGASGYAPTPDVEDRLGKDVLAVLDALKLRRSILAGHSIAGAELSAIANSHPNRIAGLIYLDAGYSYAFDDGNGASVKDMQDLHAPQPPPPDQSDVASFSALHRYYEGVNGFPFPEAELRQQRESNPDGSVGQERNVPGGAMLMTLLGGLKKYTKIPVPSIFIFANPHGLGAWVDGNPDPSIQASAKAYSTTLAALTEKQEKAVERGVHGARVVTISGAHHYVFLSNEAEVLKNIGAFSRELH